MYISAKGLFVKRNRKRSIPKAHLVVREAEKKTHTQKKIFKKITPNASTNVLRTVITILVCNRWELKGIDIKTAFLQREN